MTHDAAETTVASSRSRAEIERFLEWYGATGASASEKREGK